MTRNSFINKIKRRIDRNQSLPVTLGNDEIEDIIIDAKNWFYDNYNDSCHEFITLVPIDVFNTEHFKVNRWIEFDDCVYSVYDVLENKNFVYSERFIGGTGYIQHRIINTMYYTKTYDIITYVANLAYESVLSNLNDNYISFSWDKNSRRIHFLGHTPRTDLIIRGYKKIDETALFEDNLFSKYVEGEARIAIGEILSTYDFSLPGGVTLNADTYISRGESMIEQVKEDVNDLIKPDWFFVY